MKPISIYDDTIKTKILDWFEDSEELFVNLYYPHSGNSGVNYFVDSVSNLNKLVDEAKPEAIFSIFHKRQFSIRGAVDGELIKRVLGEIRDGEWFEIVGLDIYPDGISVYGSGNSHSELEQELQDCQGSFICVGVEPSLPNYWEWEVDKNPDIIVASKLKD